MKWKNETFLRMFKAPILWWLAAMILGLFGIMLHQENARRTSKAVLPETQQNAHYTNQSNTVAGNNLERKSREDSWQSGSNTLQINR